MILHLGERSGVTLEVVVWRSFRCFQGIDMPVSQVSAMKERNGILVNDINTVIFNYINRVEKKCANKNDKVLF